MSSEGGALKKLHRAEGGATIVGVFRVKNHDFTPKDHIFSNFREARAGCATPGSTPVLTFLAWYRHFNKKWRAEASCIDPDPQALVSFKKYMSPLRLNMFRLFVILSLTQLYRYTPEIFLFSTATFKYKYLSESRIFYFSVTETDTVTSGPF